MAEIISFGPRASARRRAREQRGDRGLRAHPRGQPAAGAARLRHGADRGAADPRAPAAPARRAAGVRHPMHLIARRRRALVALAAAGGERAAAMSYQGERELGQQFDLAVAQQRGRWSTTPRSSPTSTASASASPATLDDSYFDYQFAVIRDPRINAFAVPGRLRLRAQRPARPRCSNDDELAAVLGHEIGARPRAPHRPPAGDRRRCSTTRRCSACCCRWCSRRSARWRPPRRRPCALQYTREFEQEADYLGARYMQAAGYDPRAMLDFFKLLGDQQRASPGSAPPYLQIAPDDRRAPRTTSRRC